LVFTAPHPEHVLLDGNHRSAIISAPPFHAVLYVNWRRISPNEASATARANRWFVSIPATLRSSTTTVPYFRAMRVVILWIPSLRRSATLPWADANAVDARTHRADGVRRRLAAVSYGP
jgi:hypothetical protein